MIASADIVRAIKQQTPAALYPLARTIYRRWLAPVECWSVGVADRLLHRTYDGRLLPPARLRFKVRGSPSGNLFAHIGRQCADDLAASLARVGYPLATRQRILDFGCGCGGTLLWLPALAPEAALNGTDVDADAVAWCRANLTSASVEANGPRPPLRYPHAAFDLVYAISVFTHLDAEYQRVWLRELRRVLQPGGMALITLHGPDAWREMPAADRAALERDGFRFIRTEVSRGLFPAWYQTAFHTAEYVEATFSEFFDVVSHQPRSMSGHQDIAILRRRAD